MKLVGTDYLSIRKFHSGHHRTHFDAAASECRDCRRLNLSDVPRRGDYELIVFAALKIADGAGDGAPHAPCCAHVSGQTLVCRNDSMKPEELTS